MKRFIYKHLTAIYIAIELLLCVTVIAFVCINYMI